MTRFFRTWLVMASVALLSNWCWAQAPQYENMQPRFEGFAPGWGKQYNAGYAAPSNGPWPYEDELLPDHAPILDFDIFVDLGMKDLFAGTWVQTEYLNANFQGPGNALLGGPISTVPNPREPFLIQAGDLVETRAIVPDGTLFDMDSRNGIRTTIGIESIKGISLVGSWVGLSTISTGNRLRPGGVDPEINPEAFDLFLFPNNARFFATSVTGDRLILYDHAFEALLKAHYWSGEVNILADYHVPDSGFRMRPLIGFRYNDFDESIEQHGEFTNSSGIDPTSGVLTDPLRNTILSSTRNQMIMGQVGFQAELVDKWFTIGVTPKIAMGANLIHTHVFTSDLRDSNITEAVDDGVTSVSDNYSRFGANFDLSGHVKVHVNPWLSLTASMYYWYMPNVSRAHSSIIYEDNGIDNPPAFRTNANTTGMGITGFTVGAEARF